MSPDVYLHMTPEGVVDREVFDRVITAFFQLAREQRCRLEWYTRTKSSYLELCWMSPGGSSLYYRRYVCPHESDATQSPGTEQAQRPVRSQTSLPGVQGPDEGPAEGAVGAGPAR